MKLDNAVVPIVGVALDAESSNSRSRELAIERRAVVAAVKQLALPELQLPNRIMSISYDRALGRSVVQIVDSDTGEVVQQLPGKDVIERAHYYKALEGS